MKATITTDMSMLEYGIIEVAYWHNGQMVDFDIVTEVRTASDIELIYGKAHLKWFGKAAASILN